MNNQKATRILVAFLGTLLLAPNLEAQDESKSLCVAPLPLDALTAGTPNLECLPEKLSFQIDTRERLPWPHTKSVRIENLNAASPHKVQVYCDRKRQQSFKFRFSDYKSKEPCLFLNDLYKTVQLWESKGSPWCKCSSAP
jgi:hypothetical protein